MLVLSRRHGESLIIGDDIKITILGVSGNQIRIGIAAPEEVSVHREEVYKRISEESEPPPAANYTFATGHGNALNLDATERRFIAQHNNARPGRHRGTLGLRRRMS